MKYLCICSFISCLAFGGSGAFAGEVGSEDRLTYSIGSAVTYYGQYRLPDVPEFVRAVPLHEDDGYLAHRPLARAPIARAETEAIDLGAVGVNVVASYRRWFEFGARLNYFVVENNRVRQNQFGGTDRGEGTSLRFYDLEAKVPISVILTGGVSLPLVPTRGAWRGMRLVLGGEYDPVGTELRFTAGWDRFGRDETWRHFDVGRLHSDTFFARLDIAFGESAWAFVQINEAQLRLDLESEFKDMAVKYEGTPVVFGLRFVR